MRYFLKIAEGVDVIPLLSSLNAHPELWNQNTLRTKHPGTAHSEVSDIWVWFNDISDPVAVLNDKEVVPYPAWNILFPLRSIVLDLMRRVNAVRIGRVIVTRLPPGKTITPHVDGGAPATYYTRFQIVLQSFPGVVFNIGPEAVMFRPGEVWQINNKKEHSVINNSTDDRIVVIVDLRIE